MAINETIQEQLDLPVIEKKKSQMADGRVVEYDMAGPILIKFKDRTGTSNAFVLPGDSEHLLRVISMEEMMVLIPPQRQELIINQ